ncbi:MAG: class II aldolase/adducin family protein [Acutalibacteraceae bacterium]|jgi:rhamnose utilization protein RhaD (predicted bifunctional aldolase and dehydrogenase)
MVLKELIKFSNKYGADEELVLAGGGNTSAKEGNILYVKASGFPLAGINEEGFVKMDRRKLDEMFTKDYPDDDAVREALVLKDLMAARLPGEERKRPSVETSLHGIFPQTFVLHLHPAIVNALTCAKRGKESAEELFGNDFIWIGSTKPGYLLAKACFSAMEDYSIKNGKTANVLIMQNHGIFIAANSPEELENRLKDILNKISTRIKRLPDMSQTKLPNDGPEQMKTAIRNVLGKSVYICRDSGAEALRLSANLSEAQPLLKPFTPDHIVYCKAYPLYLESVNDFEKQYNLYSEKNGYPPKIILLKGMGFFSLASTEKEAVLAKKLFNDAVKIAVYSESFGGPLHMEDDLIDFIVNWEVESYRQKQA